MTEDDGRVYLEAICDGLLDAAAVYQSPDGARFHLPGPRPSHSGAQMDGFEGFARTFLLAAFRMVHAAPGRRSQLAERYSRGLRAGLDPASTTAWPPLLPEPHQHQAQVEAASIALALWLTREWIWDELDDTTRARAAHYLGAIANAPCTWNNWYLFHVLILTFLEQVGARRADDLVDQSLAALEPLYREPGWYVDATVVDGHTFDYYTGWADHTYTLLWTLMSGARSDDARTSEYVRRAEAYTDALVHMIGADGAPLFQGRSLLYRNAVTAPLWALALRGSSIDPGLVRVAGTRVLAHFVRHGAFDGGLPSLGWYREFLPMIQVYSGPASPFWLSKGFLGLLLPDDHPVWSAPARPLPVEEGDFVRAVPAPGLVLHGTRRDGIVRALNGGTSKDGATDDEQYDRLAFSTRTAPVVPVLGTAALHGSPDESARLLITDNWAGYVGFDGRPSLAGETRVVTAPSDAAPRVEHLVAAHLREPDQDPDAPSRTVPAVHRTSEVVDDIELRRLRIVRRDLLTLAASGFALSDDDELTRIGGPGWVGARAADGTVTALLDLTGRATLSVEVRPASPFGANTLLPVALWSFSDARQLDAGGQHRGAAQLDVGVALGRYTDDELQQWCDTHVR